MAGRSLTIGQVLTFLPQTPERIAALTADLETIQLHAAPDRGEWSANDVLAHLRACDDVWGDCIVQIVTRDAPTLQAVSPRTGSRTPTIPIKNVSHRRGRLRVVDI